MSFEKVWIYGLSHVTVEIKSAWRRKGRCSKGFNCEKGARCRCNISSHHYCYIWAVSQNGYPSRVCPYFRCPAAASTLIGYNHWMQDRAFQFSSFDLPVCASKSEQTQKQFPDRLKLSQPVTKRLPVCIYAAKIFINRPVGQWMIFPIELVWEFLRS